MYKRQILQRLRDPPLPSGNLLKDEEVQTWLARDIYNDKLTEELGATYMKHELDRVINAIQRAVRDHHEEVCSVYQTTGVLPMMTRPRASRILSLSTCRN